MWRKELAQSAFVLARRMSDIDYMAALSGNIPHCHNSNILVFSLRSNFLAHSDSFGLARQHAHLTRWTTLP